KTSEADRRQTALRELSPALHQQEKAWRDCHRPGPGSAGPAGGASVAVRAYALRWPLRSVQRPLTLLQDPIARKVHRDTFPGINGNLQSPAGTGGPGEARPLPSRFLRERVAFGQLQGKRTAQKK